jgi:glycerophosphoryl diester phosphodiesterase
MSKAANTEPRLNCEPQQRTKLRELVNIGHRGASAHAPENTIAAYDLAVSHGAHYLELDVHMTADGVLVVTHDATVERTGRAPERRAEGAITAKTLAELRALDVGRWFNETRPAVPWGNYTGLRMPTLEEVLSRYRHLARLCIELKADDADGRAEAELVRLLRLYNLDRPCNGSWRILLMAFGAHSLRRLRRLHDGLPLTRILEPGSPPAALVAQLDAIATYAGAIAPPASSVDAAVMDEAHARGLSVHPYTVNDLAEMARLLALGVDGMITDFPDRLDSLLWDRARSSSVRLDAAV